MSNLDDAISPSEAAQILSNSRWNKDDDQTPVSDGTSYFGHEGVERSAGYEPMTPHIPVKSTDEAIDSAELGEKILERQAQVAEPIERQYKQMGGPDVGKHLPENQTVSAEQASFDLTLARQQEAEAIARAEQQELARTIDEMRGEQQPPDPQQVAEATEKLRTEHPNAFPSQAQPEQTPQADDEVAKALQNPKVLAAVQEYAAQANQRADQIAQYYTQAIQQNAEAAAAAITVQWPELRGLNTQEQFRTAIQTVAATNPERARAMVQHIEQTKAVIQEQQRAASGHHQAERQRARLYFDHAAQAADDEYELWAKESVGEGQAEEIKKEALAMLRETMSQDQINWQWNNNAMFRSFPAQKMMADAARYRIAQRGIQSKAHHPVPTVQRPGSPEAREPEAGLRHVN